MDELDWLLEKIKELDTRVTDLNREVVELRAGLALSTIANIGINSPIADFDRPWQQRPIGPYNEGIIYGGSTTTSDATDCTTSGSYITQ